MSTAKKIDLGLTGYDELFMNDEQRAENKLPRIYDVPLSEIDDFPDHPFKVKMDEDMNQLVESIREKHLYFERTDPMFTSTVGRWFVEKVVAPRAGE